MGKGIKNLMKEAQKLQQRIKKAQEELGDKEMEASSGGGMVIVRANGRQEIVSIVIEPEVIQEGDIEMLQDLIKAAVNAALKKSQEFVGEELSKVTGGLKMPGLNLGM